jgi:hypothetical protein
MKPTYGAISSRAAERIDGTGSERAEVAQRSVDLPTEIFGNQDAIDAVSRGASSEKLWPIWMIGKGEAKALVNSIRLDGLPLKDEDASGWQHVASCISYSLRRQQITARWRNFAAEVGAPVTENHAATIDAAQRMIAAADAAIILARHKAQAR